MTKVLAVLVPVVGAAHGIDAGSGIVADLDAPRGDGGLVVVYFEGNRVGAVNLRHLEDRLTVAGGRLTAKYPTVARSSVPLGDFEVVGTLETDGWRFTPYPHADEALCGWVGGDWRRPENEQLAEDCRWWERKTGKSLHASLARLSSADLASMPPRLRAWVDAYMRK